MRSFRSEGNVGFIEITPHIVILIERSEEESVNAYDHVSNIAISPLKGCRIFTFVTQGFALVSGYNAP